MSPASPEPPLSIDDRRALRCLVACMIPASAEYDVPGADDELIFADVIASLGPDTAQVGVALRHLDKLSGGRFADLGEPEKRSVAQKFRDLHATLATVLIRITVQCYYRDDRVMRSLNMEPRAPFPRGFDLEQGDWSLLDPVRSRQKIYRDIS